MNVTATLFGQMITFVIFVWFIKAYLWEPLTKAMEDRTNKIADGLASAELGEKKIQEAEEHYKAQVEEAKNKASEIIGGAEQQSKNIIDTARDIAKEEAAKVAKSHEQQLEQETNAAREKLKADVAELSLLCAEKVIAEKVDKKEHDKIIKEVIGK
jgi:F-type H+-transporting ATPase subunit b|tara:strand:- start:633 stop:1100 length:468 start_codon:yes stop_codon:yes gene_type:complete